MRKDVLRTLCAACLAAFAVPGIAADDYPARPVLPIKSVAELIKLGQSTPTNYASSGNGTTSHLAAALFASSAKTPFVHVPYKSGAPGLTDLIGGQVAFMFDNVSVHLPHAQSGKLRIIATTGTARTRVTPDETRAYIGKQLEQYRKVVELAGARVE